MAGTAHPSRRPGSFETQLRKQENQRKFEAARKKKEEEQAKLKKQLNDARVTADMIKKEKIAVEKTLAEQKTLLNYLKEQSILPSSPGGVNITDGELTQINGVTNNIKSLVTRVNTYTAKYTEATNKIETLTKQASPKPNSTTNKAVKNSKANNTGGSKDKAPAGGDDAPPNPSVYYIYNAPMIKTSYLKSNGIQSQSSGRAIGAPWNYPDALKAWSNSLGAKGTIQMSRQYAYKNPSNPGKANPKYDDGLYGFKFLYNPKEVSMAWGTSTEVNWDYVSLGLDKASAVALGILKSTITFSLLLNRIGDMSYVTKNGELVHADGTTAIKTVYQATDVYPYDVSQEDLKLIYKKGTMYDLEYLFRTIMGLNSNYESSLNGRTADRGWLNAAPVELHLGDGMRYLVRISTLDVNHIMFNDRMVPILSSVNVTCHRFYDGTDASLDTSKNSTSDASGGETVGTGRKINQATGGL